MPEPRLTATIQLAAASSRRWDVLVIGAGPAGAIAAREAARSGVTVLLVDRAAFPRSKVCGCCVNAAARRVLSEVGLSDLLQQCRAPSLRAMRLASAGRFADIPLRGVVSLSRERFDTALVQAAVDAGAEYLDQAQALIAGATSGAREIVLKTVTTEASVLARVVIVAGGLGCRVFAQADADKRDVAPRSRVGAGTILDVAPEEYAGGMIYMACHQHGYVGLVRLEDSRLDVAAALDANAIKQQGGIAPLVARILAHARLPIPDSLNAAPWQGTGRLTQVREHVATERCFFIGDAAGYVEPFTGEGMSWALASGRAVVPIVLGSLRNVGESRAEQAWMETHQRLIGDRARLCRQVSRVLRYPSVVRIAVWLLKWAPSLAQPVLRSVSASFESGRSTSASILAR
jgi:flavin-dependent dehydrogenase